MADFWIGAAAGLGLGLSASAVVAGVFQRLLVLERRDKNKVARMFVESTHRIAAQSELLSKRAEKPAGKGA
jgi:cbb3-type cytochrome oxidase subunit 1